MNTVSYFKLSLSFRPQFLIAVSGHVKWGIVLQAILKVFEENFGKLKNLIDRFKYMPKP